LEGLEALEAFLLNRQRQAETRTNISTQNHDLSSKLSPWHTELWLYESGISTVWNRVWQGRRSLKPTLIIGVTDPSAFVTLRLAPPIGEP
jgi:hypothetical protein